MAALRLIVINPSKRVPVADVVPRAGTPKHLRHAAIASRTSDERRANPTIPATPGKRAMMAPEEFYEGTTRAGRVLRLFYEHTRYDTFTDETGETFDNPAETSFTGTLDGVPIEVQGWSMRGRESVTVVSDQGTFTATTTDYAEDHSETLRRYLEHRPSGGWEVAIVDRRQDGDELSYTVTITNGRLSEQAEFRFSEQVARVVADGDPPPSDEQATAVIAETIRGDDWQKIERRAEHPTTLLSRAY
jgi:hypothetical protein